MNDQAASLRQLKQLVDSERMESAPKPQNLESFLSGIIRPSPFSAIVLIVPDSLPYDYPLLKDWAPALLQHNSKSCFWDQAGLIATDSIPKTQISLKYPTPVKLDTGLSHLTVLPRIDSLNKTSSMDDSTKIEILSHLTRCLKPFSEVWISLKASELKECHPILHAADVACVTVPSHSDSILRCYETVKTIHLSGYFSPIGLLEFSPKTGTAKEVSGERIKIVAKQFLALDLVPTGMVLSNNTFSPPETDNNLRSRLSTLATGSRDFLYCLAEGLVYLIPGIY